MIVPGIFNDKFLSTQFSGKIEQYTHLGKPLLLGYIDDEDDIEFDNGDEKNSHYILIKKLAFSLNYRDRELMNLFYSECQLLPDIGYAGIGSDFVADVISCGSKVVGIKPGDRVIPNAAYPNRNAPNFIGGVPTNFASEQYDIIHQEQLFKIPHDMPIQVAAGFTVGAQTAYSIVRRLNIESGANFLITSGRSNTSLFVIQAIKALDISCNLHVITSAPVQQNDFFYNLGVSEVINISSNYSPSDIKIALKKLPQFQYIFDPMFNTYLELLSSNLDYFGKYITCGISGEQVGSGTISNNVLLQFILKSASFIGNCLGSKLDLQTAVNDYCNGRLEVIVDSVYSYKELIPFINRTYYDSNRCGKVICTL